MKLYLVTHDGYREGYGTSIYVVGIFDDLEKAKEKVKELGAEYTTLTILDLNCTYPLEIDRWGNLFNDKCLGGYVE